MALPEHERRQQPPVLTAPMPGLTTRRTACLIASRLIVGPTVPDYNLAVNHEPGEQHRTSALIPGRRCGRVFRAP